MEKLNLLDQLEKSFNTNLAFLVTIGVLVFLTKIFELITPFIIGLAFLPLIDLIIVTAGIIAVKYFFTIRSKINKSLPLVRKMRLYTQYTVYILVIIDIVYALNLLVFLVTMSWIYIIIAGLILVLYTIYRPSKDYFTGNLLSEEEKSGINLT